jgi:hypothetical protein
LVVNDDPQMSPPPSSFGGFSPIRAIGLFFCLASSVGGEQIAAGSAQICLPFDVAAKSALEYQAFRHQLIRQQLITSAC